MRSTFSTPFSEEFARRCIMLCFPEYEWNLELNQYDPPDLIDRKKNIGIEVTSAILPEDAELNFALNLYKNKELCEIPTTLQKKIDKSGGELIFDSEDGNEKLYGCLHPVRPINYNSVIDSIIKKTERLNSSDYPEFKLNALFVNDFDSFMFEKSVPDILETVHSRTYGLPREFSVIIICCGHEIYMIDAKEYSVITRYISDDDIDNLQRESLYAIGRGKEYELKSNFII